MAKSMADQIKVAMSKITGDIDDLSKKRSGALSVFRETAIELGEINETLHDRVNQLDALSAFIAGERQSAGKMIEDNERVKARILEIIGE